MIDPTKAGTAQEIFDAVWQRFVVEHAPRSVVESAERVMCAYRGPNGTACAVGCLVTDAECAGWDEASNTAIYEIASHMGLPERLQDHVYLLCDLQSCHDGGELAGVPDEDDDVEVNFETPSARAESLRFVAAKHDLAVPS